MEDAGSVRVAELRAMAEALLAHLEASGVEEIPIAHDFYWSVPPAERYDPARTPGDLTLGQLTDDLAELRAIAAGTREPAAYALVWLASLLRYSGERTPC